MRTVRRFAFVALALASAFVGCEPEEPYIADGSMAPPPWAPECPKRIPVEGDRCDARPEGDFCWYDAPGCPDGHVAVSCDAGSWNVRDTACSDAGVDSGADAGACPTSEPVQGAACSGSMTCSFENLCPLVSSKTNTWRCIGGKWSFEDPAFAPVACPAAQPRDGQACGCAMYLPSKCSYATACGTLDATCDGATQKWTVSACPSADAGADGSADAATPSDAASGDATPSDAASSDAAPGDAAPSEDAASEDAASADAPAAD